MKNIKKMTIEELKEEVKKISEKRKRYSRKSSNLYELESQCNDRIDELTPESERKPVRSYGGCTAVEFD